MIFTDSQPTYSVIDIGFDKSLTKVLLGLQDETTPELNNVFTKGIAPKNLIAGELITVLEQQAGVLFSGKTTFSDTTNGYRMGIDTDGAYKWIMGTTGQSIDWNVTTTNTLTVSGAISASTIDIGGSDATSFHVDIDGNMWLGAATFAASNAKVSNAGVITMVAGTIGGWTLSSSSLTNVSGGNTVTFSTGATAIISGPTGTPTFSVTAAGALTSTSGTIGGWTLGATTLTGGSATLDSAGDATFGTANNVIRLSATDATYRIWVGNATAANAPFSVTPAGAVKCTNITEITVASTFDLNSVLDIDSGTGANALDSTATTSDALTITGSSLTTGDLLRVYSNSADTNIRYLFEVTNDNALATGAVNIFLQQDGGNAHIRFTGDPANSSPTDGDLTYTGSKLNFYDGTRTRDMLAMMEQIGETVLGSANATITVSGFAARGDLLIMIHIVGDSADTQMHMTFNNDTGASYIYAISVNNVETQTASDTKIGLRTADTNLDLGVSGFFHVTNRAASEKCFIGSMYFTTLNRNQTLGGAWTNTADQITRVDVTTGAAATFDTGSRVTIYAKPT